jgi:guanylate kinase
MLNKEKTAHMAWIVSGPSGSGKTTLCAALLKDAVWGQRLAKSVSYTTRPLRCGEKEGRDYRHISEERFLRLKEDGGFYESEKIFGFYYGTPKKAFLDAGKAGKDLLLSIDVKGARSLRKSLGRKAVSIFVLPPGPEVLRERLRRRSTEGKKDIENRLRRVKIELSFMKDYDYIVVNDDLNAALAKLKSILTAKQCEGTYVLRTIGKAYR